MAKNINTTTTTEGRTLDAIHTELEAKVDQYNLTSDAVERAELREAMQNLTKEWNEGSMLTVYAKCLDAENPLLAFGVEYTYPTIGTKDAKHPAMVDGVKTTVFTMTIEDGERQMSLPKFLAWAKEGNHNITADKKWGDKWDAALADARSQWKRIFNTKADNTELKIGQMKKKLQDLFDSLVFIAADGGSGKNALVATSDHARWILGLANERKVDKKTKEQKVQSMSTQLWDKLAMDVWHQVCAKKGYTVIIGDEQTEEEAADAKPTDKKSGKDKSKADAKAADNK